MAIMQTWRSKRNPFHIVPFHEALKESKGITLAPCEQASFIYTRQELFINWIDLTGKSSRSSVHLFEIVYLAL